MKSSDSLHDYSNYSFRPNQIKERLIAKKGRHNDLELKTYSDEISQYLVFNLLF